MSLSRPNSDEQALYFLPHLKTFMTRKTIPLYRIPLFKTSNSVTFPYFSQIIKYLKYVNMYQSFSLLEKQIQTRNARESLACMTGAVAVFAADNTAACKSELDKSGGTCQPSLLCTWSSA